MAEASLFEIGLMFAAIGIVGVLAARARLSPVPLYVLAGMGMSEFVLGRADLPYVSESEFITIGAELGIVFLLFFLGLEFNPGRLLAERAQIGAAGLLDLGVNFGVGLLLGYALFGAVVPAILLAGIVYISSSAVISKTLIDLGWIANPESGPILGVLVFEDLVIAVYLAIVSGFVLTGGGFEAAALSAAVAFGVILFLVALAAAGSPWFERLLLTSSTEFFVLRAVGVTVLIAGAALALGVSEAVAAFFVGMAFSSTSTVHDLEQVLSPLRDTFAAVFFFWIGHVTDPTLIVDVLPLIAVVAAVTIPAKVVSGFYGGRVYGLDDRRSLRVGLGLVTRGEFSLIIGAAALASAGRALPTEEARTIYALAVGYVLVMSVLGTLLMQSSGRFEALLDRA